MAITGMYVYCCRTYEQAVSVGGVRLRAVRRVGGRRPCRGPLTWGRQARDMTVMHQASRVRLRYVLALCMCPPAHINVADIARVHRALCWRFACFRCVRLRFPCSRCVYLLCVPLLCVPVLCAFVLGVWCACAEFAYIVRHSSTSPMSHPSSPAT